MKKILEGPSRRVGSIFQEVDTNFIEVCNNIFKIAFPEDTIIGYAETEPANPAIYDCYLVREDETIWGITAEKGHILGWNGNAWERLPYKISEINEALQFLFFDADKIAILPIAGLNSSNVQYALEQITAALITANIVIPPHGSGSGSI